MIFLHGLWIPGRDGTADGKFAIWGEDSTLSATHRRPGRRAKNPQTKPRPHPFASTTEELRLPLGELTGDGICQGKPLSGQADTIALLLPSAGNGPIASPEMIPPKEDPTLLSAWEVSCITLSATQGLSLLCLLPDESESGLPGIKLTADLRFWSKVAKLALELLARQRFAPFLKSKSAESNSEAGGQKFYAQWLPVLGDPICAERVSALVRAMPPVCRAFLPIIHIDQPNHGANNGSGSIPARFSRTLVENFLQGAVDQAVRQWLAPAAKSTGWRGLRSQERKAAQASAVDKWMTALVAEDPVVDAPQRELKLLQEAVEKWTADLWTWDAGAAFRTCFRLEPPPEEEEDSPFDSGHDGRYSAQGEPSSAQGERVDPRRRKNAKPKPNDWTLRFFLQATDDRSLLVPVERVWRERGSDLTFLNRRFEQPQERLLGDLGRASRLFPPIETSLQSARPEACYLTTGQAYTFLREAAPLFEESGLGVLVPPWWGNRAASLGARLQVRPKTNGKTPSNIKGNLGLDSIVNFEWQLALGGESLTWEEFARLAELKVPLVRIRGQWVEFKPEEAEAAIEMWEKQRHQGEISLGEALRLGLDTERLDPEGQVAAGLPVVGVEAEGWIGALSKQLAEGEKLSPLPTPSTFQGELRPYQVRGFSWLAFLRQWGLGACLADDMGLGKTIQFIALLLQGREGKKPRASLSRAAPRGRRPVLLICPTSLVGNWQREVARFGPSLKVLVHHGAERHSGEEFVREAARHDLVISTYALAHRDVEQLANVPWEGIALDEAQNIKNPAAKQTQAIRQLKGDFRVALTGTPVENRLGDLWSIMEFLNPGFLGSAADFRRRFAIPIERYQDPQRSSQLKSLVQPFMLRRLKTDKSIIQDLPEKLEMKVFCNLTREQGTLYEAVVQDMMQQIEQVDGIERRGLVLATLMKLKQVCNHPAQFLRDGSPLEGRSGKLERLVEMLEEVVAAGDRALIFTQFSEMGNRLKDHLESVFHREALFLHGGVRRKVREQMVDRFQNGTPGPPFFILSIKAGGVGLNLTGANHVFHFDRWWNPAVENQATDRVHRIGQEKNVQVHKFICSGTMEDRIDELIESKRALAENIVGTGEGWLTELSTDELRDIFTLRREMVSAE